MGEAGGKSGCLDAHHAKLVSDMRKALADATSHAPASDPADQKNVFKATPVDGKDLHVDVFDGFVDPVAFSKMALEQRNAELNLWTDGYSRLVEQLAQEIEDGIPAGWQVVKDSLLDPENAEVVKTILSNKKFIPLSTAVV
jgi:hypothetical protein